MGAIRGVAALAPAPLASFVCKTFGTACGRYTGGAGGALFIAPDGRGCTVTGFLCKTFGVGCGR